MKIVGASLVGLGLLAAGGVAGSVMFPKEVPVVKEIVKTVEVPVPFKVTEVVTEEVEVEKIVNKTVEVPYENETFKKMTCDRLLFDDIEECEKEVSEEDKALNKALDFFNEEFESEIADEMEDEGIVSDEDDVELIRVYDDFEDIDVLKSDFDDKEYKFKIRFKYDDDGDKDYAHATISVEDSEVELIKVE